MARSSNVKNQVAEEYSDLAEQLNGELSPDARLSQHETAKAKNASERNGIQDVFYLTTKRFLDILVSLTILAFALPLMLLVSIAIRLSSPGPAVYCQKRLTDGRKTFTMFKFRTMRNDAEAISGAVWAADNDPRVLGIGRLLRLTRLDELPQLLNVLIGDMSLVGPRPERPELATELERTIPSFRRRTEVKAGLTGLAQIACGYASSVEGSREKLAWDLVYIRNRSLLLDFKILLKTIIVVLTRSGAR